MVLKILIFSFIPKREPSLPFLLVLFPLKHAQTNPLKDGEESRLGCCCFNLALQDLMVNDTVQVETADVYSLLLLLFCLLLLDFGVEKSQLDVT